MTTSTSTRKYMTFAATTQPKVLRELADYLETRIPQGFNLECDIELHSQIDWKSGDEVFCVTIPDLTED